MNISYIKRFIRRAIQLVLALGLLFYAAYPIVKNVLIFDNVPKPNPLPLNTIDHPNRFDEIEQRRLDRLVVEAEVERLRLERLAYLESLKMTQTVWATNYYVGDGSSGTTTASGKSIYDFEVNELGWFTYQNKVVLATMTNSCIRSRVGICNRWNSLQRGWYAHDMYDEITVLYGGKAYPGIVLDLCGSCGRSVNGELFQRIDIFIQKNPFGRVKMQIRFTRKG